VEDARGGKASGRERQETLDVSLLKAYAHPIRLQLLGVVSHRNISPAEFARERDEPIPNVSYHFRVLEKLGCIEVAGTRPARGSVEHFYRRTGTVIFDDEYWLQMPDEARRVVASVTFHDLVGRMSQAIQAGTFTARDDVHITWKPVMLDEQGWTEVMRILGSAFDEVGEAEVRAATRLAQSKQEGIVATVALAGFESPRQPPVGSAEPS
jgi:DNA-binding transcriptional ArsR family regulator